MTIIEVRDKQWIGALGGDRTVPIEIARTVDDYEKLRQSEMYHAMEWLKDKIAWLSNLVVEDRCSCGAATNPINQHAQDCRARIAIEKHA